MTWIPTPGNGEGGRLPTMNDADEYGLVWGVTLNNRHVVPVHRGAYENDNYASPAYSYVDKTTWHPKPKTQKPPAPYVPPPEPEKPKRRRLRLLQDEGVIEVVEVRDGDCDPDGARKVMEELGNVKNAQSSGRNVCDIQQYWISTETMKRWIALLKGGDA